MMLTPIFSGIVCLVLMLLPFPGWGKLKGTGMRTTLLSFYSLTVFNWCVITMTAFFPAKLPYLHPVFIFTTLMVPVMLYRFIFIVTRVGSDEKFRKVNYLFPVLVMLTHMIWALCVPRDVLTQTSLYGRHAVEGYRGFYILTSLIVTLRLLTAFVYFLLSIRRYRRYRRLMGDYFSDLRQGSLKWARIFLILWVCFLFVPLSAFAIPVKTILTSMQLAIPAIFLFMIQIWLCFNLIRGNYAFADDRRQARTAGTAAGAYKQFRAATFAKYIDHRKPYLDPNLTIVDMAEALNTNRSYLSSFINRTYGMTFPQFVNECRLCELDRIAADPANAGANNMENIASAGFGSYQSYLRALSMRGKHEAATRRTPWPAVKKSVVE